jgi:hypothetical protein
VKCSLAISAAALLLTSIGLQPAHAQSTASAIVNQAVAAEGGADALRALQSLAIKADAMHWEPGQSKEAGGEPRFLGNTSLAITWDLAKRSARTEWDRDLKYPAVEKLKFTEVVTPALGSSSTTRAPAGRCRASVSPRPCASSSAPRRPCCSR